MTNPGMEIGHTLTHIMRVTVTLAPWCEALAQAWLSESPEYQMSPDYPAFTGG